LNGNGAELERAWASRARWSRWSSGRARTTTATRSSRSNGSAPSLLASGTRTRSSPV